MQSLQAIYFHLNEWQVSYPPMFHAYGGNVSERRHDANAGNDLLFRLATPPAGRLKPYSISSVHRRGQFLFAKAKLQWGGSALKAKSIPMDCRGFPAVLIDWQASLFIANMTVTVDALTTMPQPHTLN